MKKESRQKAAVVLALAAALLLTAWRLGAWPMAEWHERAEAVDLSGDGVPETVTLRKRALCVQNGADEVVWRSETGWLVQDFRVGDVTGDGAPELLLLLYKRGSYGASRPFWVERDETGYSQHIFVYHWDERAAAPRPIWMGSALPVRVARFDLDPSGALRLTDAHSRQTLWHYHSFGFLLMENCP